jgi:chromosome transmission fidelity protein 4
MSIKGNVVSMVGHGDYFFIAYHAGATFHGDQSLAFMIIGPDLQVQKRDEIAISPESTLTWVGISDNGTPATFDSAGVLRLLSLAEALPSWTPMLDSRKLSKEDSTHYWPVGVYGENLMCVVCKAGDKHPGFPTPLINEVPLSVPFVLMDQGQSGELEEK